jgi:hypothetical protein
MQAFIPGESPPLVKIARSPWTEFGGTWEGRVFSTERFAECNGLLFGLELKNLTKITIFYPQNLP